MNDVQALQTMKELLDQAISQGLFKSTEMVLTAATALERLRVMMQERDALMKQTPPASTSEVKQ